MVPRPHCRAARAEPLVASAGEEDTSVGRLPLGLKMDDFSLLGSLRATDLSDHWQFLALLCPPFRSNAKDFRAIL